MRVCVCAHTPHVQSIRLQSNRAAQGRGSFPGSRHISSNRFSRHNCRGADPRCSRARPGTAGRRRQDSATHRSTHTCSRHTASRCTCCRATAARLGTRRSCSKCCHTPTARARGPIAALVTRLTARRMMARRASAAQLRPPPTQTSGGRNPVTYPAHSGATRVQVPITPGP